MCISSVKKHSAKQEKSNGEREGEGSLGSWYQTANHRRGTISFESNQQGIEQRFRRLTLLFDPYAPTMIEREWLGGGSDNYDGRKVVYAVGYGVGDRY